MFAQIWIDIHEMYDIRLLEISFLSELELICSHISLAIFSTLLIGFNNCNLTIIILYHINNLFAHSQMVGSIATNNSIKQLKLS